LEEVLAEGIARAKKLTGGSEEVARAVGIGAIKYNDLSQHHSSEVVFDWEKILNLRGNSGPYLQYTYARARSVLRKAGLKTNLKGLETLTLKVGLEAEEPLLRYLYRFPEIVEEATMTNSPNLICSYLFSLAQRFNRLYDLRPILRAENVELRDLRLGLTAATAQIIKNGLTLLGIEAPEKL